ncbi:MAG: cobyric acid synthase [Desulfobacterales bacterium]
MKNSLLPSRCLAVFGTGSDVGKSVIVTGLCRILRRAGFRTAPFKAQNMSNNSGVTPEGLEMGRAQIVQAEAAGIPPHVDMNPILLKPTSDVGCQVVLLGEAGGNQTVLEYHARKRLLVETALDALGRLRTDFDAVVMEGAGSCAEVNLANHDIVNFRMAEAADAPVVLAADIHRGGVFAQLVGTLECLPRHQRDRVAGFIVNRFRGDIRLFDDGVRWIEQRTGKPVFGVLPWFDRFMIEQEDSVVIERPRPVSAAGGRKPAIAVIRLPHISNFTDFDPLITLSGISVHFLERPQDLGDFKAVILPGSKNTRFDLQWLHEQGWTHRFRRYSEAGGRFLGICGGYQMMGRAVADPEGLEGTPGETAGLDLLPVETVLRAPKTTTRSLFQWEGATGTGYEIHMGRTRRTGGVSLLRILKRNGLPAHDEDGCIAPDGKAMGTYVHGLFDSPSVTRRWLDCVGLERIAVSDAHGPEARDAAYEQLADHMNRYLDIPAIMNAAGIPWPIPAA